MQVTFEYINQRKECHEPIWGGCCCSCNNQHEVLKHCCHSPKDDSCVCKESLGFYVCVYLDRACLNGKHGYCEVYVHKREQL